MESILGGRWVVGIISDHLCFVSHFKHFFTELCLFLVGGSPYPLLNNADLMMLLKTEYRMEKPDLCSDNL